ncbi:hypothetical protein [Rosistilla ulvae]|uniref:hypothetical protein n=1 Tax=Rosistilla ulvae TaxID=1930277 RepID=UPI0011A962EA|nr:hypothetical protein [Rosistilla ulvae]
MSPPKNTFSREAAVAIRVLSPLRGWSLGIAKRCQRLVVSVSSRNDEPPKKHLQPRSDRSLENPQIHPSPSVHP